MYSVGYLLFFEIGNSSIPFQDIMHAILSVVVVYYLFKRQQFRLRLHKSSGCGLASSHRPRNRLRGIFDQGRSRAWVSAAGGGVGVDEDGLYRFRNYMVSEVLDLTKIF